MVVGDAIMVVGDAIMGDAINGRDRLSQERGRDHCTARRADRDVADLPVLTTGLGRAIPP